MASERIVITVPADEVRTECDEASLEVSFDDLAGGDPDPNNIVIAHKLCCSSCAEVTRKTHEKHPNIIELSWKEAKELVWALESLLQKRETLRGQ